MFMLLPEHVGSSVIQSFWKKVYSYIMLHPSPTGCLDGGGCNEQGLDREALHISLQSPTLYRNAVPWDCAVLK